MALILNIETATDICSVAVARDGMLLAVREESSGQSHAKLLTTFISECIKEAGFELDDLHAVAVSKGPGSFTGLRIGVASAKGICYALNKPLISVNTLQSLACNFLIHNQIPAGSWLCPMIDARRMEVYTAFFNENLNYEMATSAEIIEPGSFHEVLKSHKVNFFGDGMEKTRQIFVNETNAHFFTGIVPSAAAMIRFSEENYKKAIFEQTAYFEPYYLKDFFSGK